MLDIEVDIVLSLQDKPSAGAQTFEQCGKIFLADFHSQIIQVDRTPDDDEIKSDIELLKELYNYIIV